MSRILLASLAFTLAFPSSAPTPVPLVTLGPLITIASSSSAVSKQDNGTAWNAIDDEYLVVWNEDNIPTQSDIRAQRVDAATGTLLSTFTVAGGSTVEFAPAVAWNPVDNRYLVVWVDGGTTFTFVAETFTIRAAIFNADGSIAVPAFTVSTGMAALDDCDGPRASWDGTNWLVTWFTFVNDAGGSTLDNDIHARTVSPAGLLGTLLAVEVGAGARGVNPAVAFGPAGNHLVVWNDTIANGFDGGIFGRTVKASDGTLGTVHEYTDPASVGYLRDEPSVAANTTDGEFLVGWDEDDTNNGQSDVLAARAASDGTPTGGIIPVEVDLAQNSYHALVEWSAAVNQYVMAWYHDAAGSFTFDISAVRIDNAGSVMDAVPITVATPGMSNVNPFYAHSSAASRGATGQLLVVWRVYGPAPLLLDSRRLDLNTAPDAPSAAALAQDQGALFVAGDPAGTTYAALPRTMTFRAATLTDADGHDVRLEVESVDNAAAYTGTVSTTGALGPSGGSASATLTGIPNGSYKWRARAVDSAGAASAWVEFDTAPGLDFAFNAGTTSPPAPSLGPTPTTGQFRADGVTVIVIGESVTGNVVIRADIGTDADGDQVRLEVEVQPVGVSFTGVATGTGAYGPAGNHQVVLSGIAPGRGYHWQAWSRDWSGAASGTVSAAVDFGANPPTSADFGITGPSSSKTKCASAAGGAGFSWFVLPALALLVRRRR